MNRIAQVQTLVMSVALSVAVVLLIAEYTDWLKGQRVIATADIVELTDQIPVGATPEEITRIYADFEDRIRRVSDAGILVFDVNALLSRTGTHAIPMNAALLEDVAQTVRARRAASPKAPLALTGLAPTKQAADTSVPSSILSADYLKDLPR